MAFGGRELRLILSIQSYGTTNIARLRRDIAQLSTAAEIANARQLAQARLAQRAVRVSAAEQELRNVKAGMPLYLARNKAMSAWGRANANIISTQARQLDISRRVFDIETNRIRTSQQIARQIGAAGGADPQKLELLERRMTSLNMQEAALNKSTEALNAQLAVQKTQLAQTDLAYRQLIRDTGLQSAASKEAAANLALQTEAYRQQAIAVAQLVAAEKALPFEHLEQTGRRISHIGRTAQFAGLLITAAFSLAGTMAADFSQKLYLAGTQARDMNAPISQTLERVGQLEHGFDRAGVHIDGILDLMQQFPATGDDMAEAAYDIYSSMNVSFGQGLELLKSFNQVAVATGGELKVATNAGITVLNNFGKTSGNVDEILNLMIATIRFGRMHLEEFNAMLEKVAPAAAAAGQRFEDVAGAMALLTTRQPSQRVSATGIARLLQTFQDPDFQRGLFNISQGLVDITKGRGAVGVLKPLPDIIDQMARSFGLFQKFGGPQQLFRELTATGRGRGVGRQSRIEAWRAYTFLIKNVEDYRDLQRKTTGDVTEFAKALAVMSRAPGVRWQVFLNQMRAFIIIIGEAALPALLKVGDVVIRAAHWFENLNEGTRKWIVQLGVFLGIGGLVLGTLGNIIGSMIALAANIKIMQIQRLTALQAELAATGNAAATAGYKAGFLLTTLRVMAGLGIIAIPIVLQLIKGGDPGAWDLLGGVLGGAVGGFMIGGPAGAAIGAITVPAIMQITTGDKLPKLTPQQAKAIGQALGMDVGKELDIGELKKLKEFVKEHPQAAEKLRKKLEAIGDSRNKDQKGLNDKALELADQFNKDYLQKQLDLSKQLNDAYQAQDAAQSDAIRRSEQLARERVQAVEQAIQNMQQKIGSAVDNLTSIYERFAQQNEQALGSLFGGPVMQGFFGDTFRQINDQLRQFGVQIPIPFKILQMDMKQQLAYFKRWRKDLNKLLARGAPLEFVQQLQEMGPEAGIAIAEGLLQEPKKGFDGLIKDWKRIHGPNGVLRKATQADMDRQLDDWMKHGKNVALHLIMGLSSDFAQMQLKKGFRQYVVGTFGDVLKAQMASEVRKAMRQAMKELAASGAITTVGQAKPPTTVAAQRAAREAQIPIRQLSVAQTRRQIRRVQRRLRPLHELRRLHPDILTPEQWRQIDKLEERQRRLRKHARDLRERRDRAQRERMSQKELHTTRTQREGLRTPGRTLSNVTYEGDTVTIHADGATPDAVTRALNKHKFRKRSRHRYRPPRL